MNTFGERLKDLRTKKGCTQREIAEMVGRSQWTVCNWENNRIKPNKDDLCDLATLFDVKPDYLLHGEVTKVFTVPKKDIPQVTMTWADELPPKKEEPAPMPSPIKKDDAVVYRAEDGRKLDDINLIIRHLRDMKITDEEKKRLHKRLSQMRTEVESIVLFGE